MKTKIAAVGVAHFLSQLLNQQPQPEVHQASKNESQITATQADESKLPEAFERKIKESKSKIIIASPSHESTTSANGHGKS